MVREMNLRRSCTATEAFGEPNSAGSEGVCCGAGRRSAVSCGKTLPMLLPHRQSDVKTAAAPSRRVIGTPVADGWLYRRSRLVDAQPSADPRCSAACRARAPLPDATSGAILRSRTRAPEAHPPCRSGDRCCSYRRTTSACSAARRHPRPMPSSSISRTPFRRAKEGRAPSRAGRRHGDRPQWRHRLRPHQYGRQRSRPR